MRKLLLDNVDSNHVDEGLNTLSDVWARERSFFDPKIYEVFNRVGGRGHYEVGVYVFALAQRGVLVVLTDYDHADRSVSIQVVAKGYGAWSGLEVLEGDEEKACTFILKAIETAEHTPESLGIFRCPKCNAVYSAETLKMDEHGRVQCQNCLQWTPFMDVSVDEVYPPNDS